MKNSNLLWAAYPVCMTAVTFGLIAAVNWGYERKLLETRPDATDWPSQHFGPVLLTSAIGMTLLGSLILLVVGTFWPKSRTGWFLVPVIVVSVFLVFPSLFIVILGPAAITSIEQTNSVPAR